jgi:malonate-semialdehyde dehydrogenase (acetylating) / methylmalonate-semialdehyde dehydrogenase
MHYWNGDWWAGSSPDVLAVEDPARAQRIAELHPATAEETNQAVEAAHAAFQTWRRVPVTERIQPLFKLKALLEQELDNIARIITTECGKTLAESKGELRRAIENVEVACGMPILIQSNFNEGIASGIDEFSIRQPLGVAAILCPFNFPAMIPFWFWPYAVATGCTVVTKPSERVPLTMQAVAKLVEQCGFPKGVFNIVQGGKQTSEALMDHPLVKTVSFVGSSAAARQVYLRSAQNGKRVQCQGGAKNPVVILPDAEVETGTQVIADSAFGCAGQRCLASSVAVLIGDANKTFGDSLRNAASTRKTGHGLEGADMGPVISAASQQRLQTLLAEAEQHGAKATVDGRKHDLNAGYFLKPTILEGLPESSPLIRTEFFGPVLTLIEKPDIESALDFINSGAYGNMACLFTRSGEAARRFRTEAEVGNVGINVGVAAPMAFFPFSGARESFFGDLHGQGRDAVRFFTNEKVVVERWPKDWSRKF